MLGGSQPLQYVRRLTPASPLLSSQTYKKTKKGLLLRCVISDNPAPSELKPPIESGRSGEGIRRPSMKNLTAEDGHTATGHQWRFQVTLSPPSRRFPPPPHAPRTALLPFPSPASTVRGRPLPHTPKHVPSADAPSPRPSFAPKSPEAEALPQRLPRSPRCLVSSFSHFFACPGLEMTQPELSTLQPFSIHSLARYAARHWSAQRFDPPIYNTS